MVFGLSLHLFLPPSLSIWHNKPIRTMSSILTFPQRATHSSHNTTVPSLPFTLSSFTFFTSLCYRSPLESYLAPLCLPYRSAPAHHTQRQAKSSISPGKRCREGAAQPGAGLEGRRVSGRGEWGKTGLFHYRLKRVICWLRLLTMEGKRQRG